MITIRKTVIEGTSHVVFAWVALCTVAILFQFSGETVIGQALMLLPAIIQWGWPYVVGRLATNKSRRTHDALFCMVLAAITVVLVLIFSDPYQVQNFDYLEDIAIIVLLVAYVAFSVRLAHAARERDPSSGFLIMLVAVFYWPLCFGWIKMKVGLDS